MIIDTHCHLYDEQFKEDCQNIINNGKNDNIKAFVVCGADMESSKQALELSKNNENVFAIIGCHPEGAGEFGEKDVDFLLENANNEKVVAIGEIGLDYHYEGINKQTQQQIFVKQLEIANKVGLPVCIHLRDAYEDFLNIIEKNSHLINNGGVIHCYSGSLEYAKQMIKFGFKLGIDGPFTFKNNKKTVEVVENLPLEHFVVETDCPYLSPEPVRGTRNEPKNLNYIVAKIASVKGLTIEQVEKTLIENSKTLYPKLKSFIKD